MNKTLKIYVPVDENLETSIELILMSRHSYTKEFWDSFAPPHKVVYIISGLSDAGIENWKDAFRELFSESKYKDHCRFEITEKSPSLSTLLTIEQHDNRVRHLGHNKYFTGVLCPKCNESELQFISPGEYYTSNPMLADVKCFKCEHTTRIKVKTNEKDNHRTIR